MSRRRRRAGRGGGNRQITPLRIAALVAIVGVVVIAVVVVISQGGGNGGPGSNPIRSTAESIAIGAGLFENNCQVCHGADGKGGPNAADLTLHIPLMSEGAMFNRISEGFPVGATEQQMPAFKDDLTETERWHLVNFLKDAFEDAFTPVLPDDNSE